MSNQYKRHSSSKCYSTAKPAISIRDCQNQLTTFQENNHKSAAADSWKTYKTHDNEEEYISVLLDLSKKRDLFSVRKCIVVLHDMHKSGNVPSTKVYSLILDACLLNNDIQNAKYIHSLAVKNNIPFDSFMFKSLIYIYSCNGYVAEAIKTFEKMQTNRLSVKYLHSDLDTLKEFVTQSGLSYTLYSAAESEFKLKYNLHDLISFADPKVMNRTLQQALSTTQTLKEPQKDIYPDVSETWKSMYCPNKVQFRVPTTIHKPIRMHKVDKPPEQNSEFGIFTTCFLPDMLSKERQRSTEVSNLYSFINHSSGNPENTANKHEYYVKIIDEYKAGNIALTKSMCSIVMRNLASDPEACIDLYYTLVQKEMKPTEGIVSALMFALQKSHDHNHARTAILLFESDPSIAERVSNVTWGWYASCVYKYTRSWKEALHVRSIMYEKTGLLPNVVFYKRLMNVALSLKLYRDVNVLYNAMMKEDGIVPCIGCVRMMYIALDLTE